MLYLGQGFLELLITAQASRTGLLSKSRSPPSHKEYHVGLAVWVILRTGTFLASVTVGKVRTSCNVSQWTDRYLIISGRSQAQSPKTLLP